MSQENSVIPNIAHYQIVSRVGTGGMGEVYLADDTRLGRKVALKVLLDNHAADSDTRRRFGQEARAASGLNHPNIITIYETGEWENKDYIAMEYVQGQSVRDLITQNQLSLGDAINIAAQVASALAAAHAVGIIHRDIKPENIIRRPDGLIKVLDFGLAKQTAAVPEPIEVDSEAPTYGAVGTVPGMVMGTVPYMSPEQARGKPVDQRTDIWSLGVVLYEMASGRPPFFGETKSDLLASILTKEPDALRLSSQEASREVDHIIRKALFKDRDARYQSVRDMALDLKILQSDLDSGSFHTDELSHTTAEESTVPTHGRTTGAASTAFRPANKWLWPAVAALLAVGSAALWFVWQRTHSGETSRTPTLSSTQITTWKSDLGEGHTDRAQFSPDGRLIAYVAPKEGRSSIWLKQTSGGEPFTRKQDDSTDISPVWSPDGERIAYISNRGGKRGIWSAPALGGSPILIAPADSRAILVHWSKDGRTIYFDSGENLNALDVGTGQVKRLTDFDESRFTDHAFALSPDERRMVFADRRDDQSDLWAADIDGSNQIRLTNDAFDDGTPVWHPDGDRIVYTSERDGTKQIFLAYLDGREPSQLMLSDGDLAISDISPNGKQILYHSEKDDSDLWSVDLDTGRESQTTSDLGPEFWPDVAPNGSAIVYQGARRSSLGSKVRSCQIFSQQISANAQASQIAPNGFNAKWSPDGRQIAFLRDSAGNNSLWLASAHGGDERKLTDGGVLFAGYSLLPYVRVQARDFDWSPDGRSIVYGASRAGASNIWRVDVAGGETQLTNNGEKGLLFMNPIFSPDGAAIAWLALKFGPPETRRWTVWLRKEENVLQLYESSSPLRLIGWAANGSDLIVQTTTSGNEVVRTPVGMKILQIGPITGAAPREIAKLKGAYLHNIAISPDRHTLAFVTHDDSGDSIQIQQLPGGIPKKIATSNDPRVYYSNLVFAPDGRTLFYGKQANWQVISIINNFK